MKVTLPERFLAKVAVETDTGCWNWTACSVAGGYGRYWEGGRYAPAHRFAYEQMVSDIPAGHVLDHTCSNPRCVNPSHLEIVTQAENIQRGHARRTLCKNGLHPNEGKRCVPCALARRSRYRKRHLTEQAAYLRAWRKKKERGRVVLCV